MADSGDSSFSNTTQSSTTSTEIVKIVGDLPKLAEQYWFDGLNLLQWSSYVGMILRGWRLDHHLTNEPPSSKDPSYARWHEEEGTLQFGYWRICLQRSVTSTYICKLLKPYGRRHVRHILKSMRISDLLTCTEVNSVDAR